MIRILVFTVILLGAPTLGYTQGPQAGLAYFSPARAFALSADGKTAQAKIAALQVEKEGQVNARRRSLQAQQDELTKSGSLLGDAARAQRSQAIERFELDLQRFIQDAQQELMGVQRDLENAFLVKLRPALADVAKSRSLALVINEDVGLIAWADPGLDITPVVVDALVKAEAPPPR